MEVSGQLHFPPHSGTHWIGGRVGPRSGIDVLAKRQYPCRCWESNPGRPARSLVAVPAPTQRSFRIIILNVIVLACFLESRIYEFNLDLG